MLKKKLFIFAALIILIFGLLSYQSIKGGTRFFDLPLYPLEILEKVAFDIVKGTKRILHTYILLTGKEEENRDLLKKISELEQEKNSLIEVAYENKRLTKILKVSSEKPGYVASARVFARDPTNWFQVLWINKGKEEGVDTGMVAVASIGPVGRIHRVFENGSSVILITDVNSSVAVRLQSTRIEGILEGRGDNKCDLKYVSKEVKVKKGDKVITSGLDGIYPAGLLIGTVSAVREEGEEMFKVIEVDPIQDLNSVEEVAILKK